MTTTYPFSFHWLKFQIVIVRQAFHFKEWGHFCLSLVWYLQNLLYVFRHNWVDLNCLLPLTKWVNLNFEKSQHKGLCLKVHLMIFGAYFTRLDQPEMKHFCSQNHLCSCLALSVILVWDLCRFLWLEVHQNCRFRDHILKPPRLN